MNSKKLAVASIILVVLVGIITLTSFLEKSGPSAKGKAFFPDIDEEDIASLLIVSSSDSILLRRKGDIWVVSEKQESAAGADKESVLPSPGMDEEEQSKPDTTDKSVASSMNSKEYRADSAAIQTALEKLVSMNKDELISQNPERQELFQVDSASGLLVKVYDLGERQIGSFYIGKNGSDWSSHYVRAVGSESVYSVRGSIKSAFFTTVKRWRDKTILSFDPLSVTTLSLAKNTGEVIEISKTTDSAGTAEWMITSPVSHKAKKSDVDDMVSSLSQFKCTDWASQSANDTVSYGFDNPELAVTVTLSNGDKKVVLVGNTVGDEKKFYVKNPEKTQVFIVNDYSITKFDKDAETLKAEEATADPTMKDNEVQS